MIYLSAGICLFLLVVFVVLSGAERGRISRVQLFSVGIGLASLIAGIMRLPALGIYAPHLAGLGAGLIASALASLLSDQNVRGGALATAGALAAAFPALPDSTFGFTIFSAALGCALGAFARRMDGGDNGERSAVALYTLAGGAMNLFAANSLPDSSIYGVGSLVLAWCALVVLVSKQAKISSWLVTSFAAAVLLIVGGVVASKYFSEIAIMIPAIAGSIAGVVVVGFAKEFPTRLAMMGTALVWLAVATFGFQQGRALGIGVALVCGLTIWAVAGTNRIPLIASLPAIGLLIFRLFRAIYPDVSVAIDLGQHYAIVGFVVGATLVLALTTWFDIRRTPLSEALFVAGMALSLLTATILLGAKGAVGMLLGIFTSATFAMLELASAVTIVTGLVATLAIAYPLLSVTFTAPKEERQSKVIQFALAAIIVTGLSLLPNRNSKQTQESNV